LSTRRKPPQQISQWLPYTASSACAQWNRFSSSFLQKRKKALQIIKIMIYCSYVPVLLKKQEILERRTAFFA
jgi:hypothetical protein